MKLLEFVQLFLMITVSLGGFLVSAAIFAFLATVIPAALAVLVFFVLLALVVALMSIIYEWEPLSRYPAWETFGDTFIPEHYLGPVDGGDER